MCLDVNYSKTSTNAGGIVEKDQIFKWLDRSAIDWRVELVDNFILFNSQFNLVNNDVVCFVGVLDSRLYGR